MALVTMATLLVDIGFSAPTTGDYLHLDDTERGLLDTGRLAPVTLFSDVSQYVVSVRTRRGATRADGPTLRYESGEITIVLNNDDRRFDPTNLGGPYVVSGVTQIEPMRVVRFRAAWGGVTYPLWWGYSDNWQVSYPGPNSSIVTLTGFDAFGVFANYDRGPVAVPAGAGENSGARVHRILNSIGWAPSARVIDTGDSTLQGTLLGGTALSELQLTSDSELGEFWMDAQGRATFRRRRAILQAKRSVRPNACFGDAPVEGVTTTVNLVTNPSAESTTTGWGASGSPSPALARSTTQARFGTWSLRATWGTGGTPGVTYTVSDLIVGRTYTVSVYAYVPSGSPPVALISSGTWGTGTEGLTDQWVRLTWSGLATATTRTITVSPTSTPTSGQQVYLDGLQMEEGSRATAYTDGDQTEAEWDGDPHASTSRRLPELPYADLVMANDVQSINNLLSITRVGGTEQVVEDSGSRSAYLTRTHRRTDLLLETDEAALNYAQTLLYIASRPELRFAALVLNPRGDADRLYPQALGREIGDRVRIVRRPPGGGDPMVREAFVRGIEHEVTADLTWKTTLVLQSATRYSFFILDNPVAGRLDENALAGF